MVNIQSATAEIKRGKSKKERRRKKEEERKKQGKNTMSAFATQGGHKHNEMITCIITYGVLPNN